MGIFRLAPQDYHRFHIPVDGIMGEPKLIAGEYYTVNPMAIRSALDVYGENIRVLVPIDSERHGRVMVICVGAMMVGSTIITRKTGEKVHRAEELGYFKFGKSPTSSGLRMRANVHLQVAARCWFSSSPGKWNSTPILLRIRTAHWRRW